MGTALIARGLGDALPEEWVLGRPDEIAAVHAEHAAAAAAVVLTCTFNLAAPRLARRLAAGRLAAIAPAAVALARGAAPGCEVAGALGPTLLAEPGKPPPRQTIAAYARAADALAAAGADLLWIESQYELREARLALAAARATGLPAVLTFSLRERDGRLETPAGERAEECLLVAAEAGAAATGVNCVFTGPALTALARWAAGRLPVPLVLKPSPGLPGETAPPDAFAAALAPALGAGAALAGGCCGATGEHLRAIAAVWPALPP